MWNAVWEWGTSTLAQSCPQTKFLLVILPHIVHRIMVHQSDCNSLQVSCDSVSLWKFFITPIIKVNFLLTPIVNWTMRKFGLGTYVLVEGNIVESVIFNWQCMYSVHAHRWRWLVVWTSTWLCVEPATLFPPITTSHRLKPRPSEEETSRLVDNSSQMKNYYKSTTTHILSGFVYCQLFVYSNCIFRSWISYCSVVL